MKKLEIPGRSLSKAEQKMIIGGTGEACLPVGDDCNANVQCCSNNCAVAHNSSTGYKCGNSVGNEEIVP